MANNTKDLSEFGYVELAEAAKLLTAYCDGGNYDFLQDGVTVEFNPNSGNVFLVDSDYNVGMMNGDDLEQWLNCPECGEEGFLEDLKEYAKDCCWDWMEESGLVEENERYTSKVIEGQTSSGSCKLEDIVTGIENLLPDELLEEFNLYDDSPDDDETRAGIFDEICDHLNDIAPEGLEFGAQEGDGACFGFWKIAEEED